MQITWNDFEKVEIRVGEIISVEEFAKARVPAYQLKIDFGLEIGVKQSSAQATNYSKEELLGMQVVAVVNFPPKQIANFFSEALVIGTPGIDGNVSLLSPTKKAVLGSRIY